MLYMQFKIYTENKEEIYTISSFRKVTVIYRFTCIENIYVREQRAHMLYQCHPKKTMEQQKNHKFFSLELNEVKSNLID